jgi:hypothetical protein
MPHELVILCIYAICQPPMSKKSEPSPKKPRDRGLGIKHDTAPISVMLPPELERYVRALPNRSEWLRRVIAAAIAAEKGA